MNSNKNISTESVDDLLRTKLGKSMDSVVFDQAQPSLNKPLALQFTASAGEYFRVWVVCQLLTVLTLGLYGPWARTRKARFLASHWLLDGQAFSCELAPLSMLRGRLLIMVIMGVFVFIADWNVWFGVAVFAICSLVAPLLIASSFGFRWKTLTYRSVRFDANLNGRSLWLPFLVLTLGFLLIQWKINFDPWVVNMGFDTSPSDYAGLMAQQLFNILHLVYLLPCCMAAMTWFRFSNVHWGASKLDMQYLRKEKSLLVWCKSTPMVCWIFYVAYAGWAVYWLGKLSPLIWALATHVIFALTVYFNLTFAKTRSLNFALNSLHLGGLSFQSAIGPMQAGMRSVGYLLLAVVTLGLSIPWSTVNYSRWRSGKVVPHLQGDWSQFASSGAVPTVGHTWDDAAHFLDFEVAL
jgi:uncharacterized membrane protein YjgN (DUF898 family)